MKKALMSKNSLMFFLALLGLMYYFVIQVEIIPQKAQQAQFTLTIKSHINQNIKLDMMVKNVDIVSFECNDKQHFFKTGEKKWFETGEQEVVAAIHEGSNDCKVKISDNYGDNIVVKQKMMFVDYYILFILLGIPAFHVIFKIFLWLLRLIKNKRSYIKFDTTSLWLPLILLLGIVIRVLYIQKYGIVTFQHDWHAHIELIKYMANHWTLPMPLKGLEFPQQPLYYIVTGGIYSLLAQMGLSENGALYGVGYFSLFCSFVFLYYGYKFIVLVLESHWARVVAMLFLSLTPAIVYLAAYINNDVLVIALSAFSLYYIVRSYYSDFREGFWRALIGVSLLFMTKLSAAPIEILFLSLLIYKYLVLQEHQIKNIQQRIYWYGIVGIFLLGFTLLRVYSPLDNTFHMVISTGEYPGQEIGNLDFGYFFSFRILPLLHTGYSYVFGNESISHSYLTYQYGTMFFGEFNYQAFFENYASVRWTMQGVLFFGLIYVFGVFSFAAQFKSVSFLGKTLFIVLIINFIIILKFAVTYPSISNTDFRYFAASFPILAFVFAQGLSYMRKYSSLAIIINIFLFFLFFSEVSFYAALLFRQ